MPLERPRRSAESPAPHTPRAGGREAVPRTRIETTAHDGALVTFTSPSGGVGLTTLMAMCALAVGGKGVSRALMDADLAGGGLGVLLGVEYEPGLSLQDLNAPLGHIEGNALNHELPQWEGMRVLAHTPWTGRNPDWWEIQAAVRALREANDLVLVDAGRGTVLEHIPELASATQVVAVELSALGLARAKSHFAMLERFAQYAATGGPEATDDPGFEETMASSSSPFAMPPMRPPIVVGVEPRSTARCAPSATALREAAARFGEDALGPLRHDPSLCADLTNGLGVRTVPKGCRQVVEALAGLIVDPQPDTAERSAGRRSRRPRRARS